MDGAPKRQKLDNDNCDFDSDTDSDIDSDCDLEILASVIPSRTRNQTNEATSDEKRSSNPINSKKEIVFTASTGMQLFPPKNDAIDLFNLLANENFYEHITKETNQYAAEVLKMSDGIIFTKDDFKIWLGLLFSMGTVRLDNLNDYWKKSVFFDHPIFEKHMSKDKFLLILRALDFNCKEEDKKNMDKIDPLIDHFNKMMNIVYKPLKELTIDEPLILHKGQLSFHRYMKEEFSQNDIKLFTLREAKGLVLKIIIDDGSEDVETQNHKDKIVEKLLQGKMGIGHSVYMNTYFSNVELTKKLLRQNTYVTGLLKASRKDNPENVTFEKLEVDDCTFQYSLGGIFFLKWRDRRETMMISSEFDGQLTEARNKRDQIVTKPRMLFEYNNNMGGVDYHDQLMSHYPCEHKTLRWYKKIAIHVFQSMLLNSYYLYNKFNCSDKTFYDFRMEVILSLLGNPSHIVFVPFKKTYHLPKYCPRGIDGRTKRRRCRYCYVELKIRKDTTMFCPQCEGCPGLCLSPCFELFHESR